MMHDAKLIAVLEERSNHVLKKSEEAVQDADKKVRESRYVLWHHEEWCEVVDALGSVPGEVSVVDGLIKISEKALEHIPVEIIEKTNETPPQWVQKVVAERHLMFKVQHQANEKTQTALLLERELQRFLNENKMALTNDHQRTVAVAKTKLQSIEGFRQGMDGLYR